ncbi:unnamed protein product [Symbiodinium necroappetens]|uniref:Uncharacterized protein n=1 Tax=Symbiodinium necroappetens TaxID=1628268 RepID=A0A812UD27_9DINO|nr:unnamed protein product [Symbiodinium necroappetens]
MELVTEFIGAPFESGGLLLDWPGVPPRSCVFVPLILREGGVLAAIPAGFLDASLISAGQAGAANAIVGPSREVSVGTLEEEEEGALVPTEEICTVLLVDFSEEVYPLLSRYDPVTSPAEAAHVVPESPHLQVSFEEARQSALAWVASEEGERLAFYSAAEGADAAPAPGGPLEAAAPKRKTAPRAKRPTNAQLSEQLGALVELIPSLTQQVQELATRQAALEKRAAPVAAPPLPAHRLAFPQRFELRAGESYVAAEQSPRSSSQIAVGTFSFRRAELAQRRPVFTSYAERFGGFGSQRSLGIVFWLLANIADSMIAGDQAGAEELTALALAAVEQCAQDGGSWEIGFLLTLLEDPPHQLFQHRPQSQNPRLRAFGGLTPQTWATTTLSYVKEIDAIQSRPRLLQSLAARGLLLFEPLRVSPLLVLKAPSTLLLVRVFQGVPVVAKPAVGPLKSLGRHRLGAPVTSPGQATASCTRSLPFAGSVPWVFPAHPLSQGSANWDPLPFLASDPNLQMAYLVAKLALKWADQGLLYLKDDFSDQQSPSDCVRVFNCFKSLSSDRQIGDRIAVADRKDFYHQLRVGDRKACHNALYPPLSEAFFVGTAAHDELLRRRAGGRKTPSLLVPPPDRRKVVAGFKAIFQGDHLGVEFATCAHRSLLQGAGLLTPDQEVRANSLFPESLLYQGLVIDDFYAISIEKPELPPEVSAAVRCLDRALLTYAEHGLLGSSEKDVRGADTARVAGTELDASSRTRQDGIVGAGALRSKRLSLASISLSVAALPSTTDVLHSCLMGGWVSTFLYRRPLMSVFAKSFGLVRADLLDPSRPQTVHLPRGVADELALAAALAPLAVSDIAAPFDDKIYATDSSEEGAAVVEARVSPSLTALLWRSSDRKGAATKLLTRAQAALRKIDPLFEERAGVEGDDHRELLTTTGFAVAPSRPIGLRFHFLQVGCPARNLCDALASFGWVVGPILDSAFSPHYGLLDPVFFSWLLHMLETESVDALYLRPSAKTFSAATVPPFRTYREPFGDPLDPRVRRGTLQALRALTLFQVARLSKAICLIEQPVGSLMAALPSWKAFREKPGVLETRTSVCMFGASSAQRVRLLSCHFSPVGLERACSGGHPHTPPGSSGCFASSLEVPGFATVLAEAVSSSLRRKVIRTQSSEIDVFGLESVLVNDLAQALPWKSLKVWRWKKQAHINVLESEAFLRLCLFKARQAQPSRFVSLIDSNVARCSLGKGRSPSAALTSVLRRTASVSLACGLYGALPFCPTRLMPADAPSRGAPVLEARSDPFGCLPSLTYVPPAFDFDSSLGFPGEGRPVEKITQKHRDRLWAVFLEWTGEIGVPAGLFEAGAEVDIDSINAVLAKYGRALYETGRPYNHYAEIVNALASRIPKIRRLLQPAWDVAFQWQRMEPHVHHQAMPWQVLLAMCSTALCWGWKEVAGTLALAWGGLARIGEIFAARRCDLVLPCDVGELDGYILLSVREPKTRNTAARHQALRLDQPQLVRLVSRFAKLLTALHLDKLDTTNLKALDLGSLRAGGATWLLQTSEDGELVRRRPEIEFYLRLLLFRRCLRKPRVTWVRWVEAARKCKHLYHCLEEQKRVMAEVELEALCL